MPKRLTVVAIAGIIDGGLRCRDFIASERLVYFCSSACCPLRGFLIAAHVLQPLYRAEGGRILLEM